jgi:chitinase
MTVDGTAVAGSDYTAASGTLTFAAGTTSRTVSVPIVTDGLYEVDETFQLRIGGASGTCTIQNDDPPPSLSVADVSVTEGTDGTKSLPFTVSLSEVSGRATTVSYATSDATALAGSDYTATSGTLTIPAGSATGTVNVPLVTDRIFEADETLTLTLTSPSGATLGTAVATGTIVNDDLAGLSVNDVSMKEGRSGTSAMTFTVTLAPTNAGTVTVDYATVDGSAVAGTDYVAASGTLTFPAGTTTRTVSVLVMGDILPEGSETFTLRLSNASGAGACQVSCV